MMRITLDDLRVRVRRHPRDSRASYALGSAYLARREFAAALPHLRRAAELDPADAAPLSDLASALDWTGEPGDALRALKLAVRLQPSSVAARLRLAHAVEREEGTHAALGAFVAAVEAAPCDPEPSIQVCRLLLDGRSGAEAFSRAAAALHVAGDARREAGLRKAVAAAHHWYGRYEEARAWWDDELARTPRDLTALLGRFETATALGECDAAARLCERAALVHPEDVTAMYARFRHAVGSGRLEAGRQAMRHMLASGRIGQPSQPGMAPVWSGDERLDGRTVLVECEGAFGDQFQFARFARAVHDRGARVILQCLPQLREVMQRMPCVDLAVSPYDECGPVEFQCRADIVAFLLEWDREWTRRHTPYLSVDAAIRSRWRARFAGPRRHVGILWRAQGLSVTCSLPPHKQPRNHYAFRSAPLEAFRALSALPDTAVVGLQVGAGTEEITASVREWLADDLAASCRDFMEAAGAIAALDAVVTIDSAIAHLAGALGTPCCLMLPYFPEFRWFSDPAPFRQGEISPWYPTMRVFRQPRPGDWSSVMSLVTRALDQIAAVATPAGAGSAGRRAQMEWSDVS